MSSQIVVFVVQIGHRAFRLFVDPRGHVPRALVLVEARLHLLDQRALVVVQTEQPGRVDGLSLHLIEDGGIVRLRLRLWFRLWFWFWFRLWLWLWC